MAYLGFSTDRLEGEAARFVEAYKKRTGQIPEMFGARGYDGMKMLGEAIRRAGSADPRLFRAELAKMKNFPGVTGVMTIKADREPVKSPLCLLEVKGGKYVLRKKIPIKTD